MKTRLLYVPAAAALLALLALAAPRPTTAQVPPDDTNLEALADELTLQTAELVNQQAAMEAQIDHISEMVRQARIYSARGGSRK